MQSVYNLTYKIGTEFWWILVLTLELISSLFRENVEEFSLDDSESEGEEDEEFSFDPNKPAPNERVVMRPGELLVSF